MRVTNNMMTANLLYNVNKNLEYMSKRQDELATGKRIHKPSDDPVLASKILARRTDLSELEQYDKNTRDALGWLEVTEKALEDNGDIFQRIRELTVQAANGVNTAEETQKIKTEIENMRSQLVSNANTTFAGRYIFSGFETNEKLMNDDGTYNIDIDNYTKNNKPVVKYEVSVGESIDVMTNGLDIYGVLLESNSMHSIMPSPINNQGVAAEKSSMAANFSLTTTYAAGSLDFTIGGTPISIPTATLNGSATYPIKKEEVLDVYNTALGNNGTAYFNADNQLVVESALHGTANNIAFAGTGGYNPTPQNGVDKVEASLTGPTYGPSLTSEDQEFLRNNPVIIVVNGVSKKLTPAPGDPVTTLDEYATAINNRATLEFGADQVVIETNVTNDQLIIRTTSPAPVPPAEDEDIHIQADLTVDFPRSRTSQMMNDIDKLIGFLETGNNKEIGDMLDTIDTHMNNMLSLRADIGARVNRMEMITKKISSNNVSFTQLLSDAQDADMSEVIMKLKNAENVYKASLSTGARVIQPSLVDFLR